MVATLAELSSRLNLRARSPSPDLPRCLREKKRLPSIILVTDAARQSDPYDSIEALPRGSAVIFRHYQVDDREGLARKISGLCRRKGIALLLSGDPAMALRVRAGGIHFPQRLLVPGMARAGAICFTQKNWLISAAAHSFPALVSAHKIGVDLALLSPVFATRSHPGGKAIGPTPFAAMVRNSPVPVYALGGINQRNFPRIAQSGISGIAALEGLTP